MTHRIEQTLTGLEWLKGRLKDYYDFDSEEDHCVTVRDRDSMEQERVAISDLKDYSEEKFDF